MPLADGRQEHFAAMNYMWCRKQAFYLIIKVLFLLTLQLIRYARPLRKLNIAVFLVLLITQGLSVRLYG